MHGHDNNIAVNGDVEVASFGKQIVQVMHDAGVHVERCSENASLILVGQVQKYNGDLVTNLVVGEYHDGPFAGDTRGVPGVGGIRSRRLPCAHASVRAVPGT